MIALLIDPQITQVGAETSAFQKKKSLLKAIFCTTPGYLSLSLHVFSQLYSKREDIIRATYFSMIILLNQENCCTFKKDNAKALLLGLHNMLTSKILLWLFWQILPLGYDSQFVRMVSFTPQFSFSLKKKLNQHCVTFVGVCRSSLQDYST